MPHFYRANNSGFTHKLRTNYIILSLLFCGLNFPTIQAQIKINEVMSQNVQTKIDEDGDFPDWIELYNGSDSAFNLAGYGLSDKPSQPLQWLFPQVDIPAKGFMLIFASDKDRRIPPLYWETVVTINDSFAYTIPATSLNGWELPIYNDSSWNIGRSGFGYGDNDDSTLVPSGTMAVYMRKLFYVNDPSFVKKMILNMDFDDAFVAYLNGHEIARAQIGTPGVKPEYNAPADNANHEARMYQGGIPESYSIDSLIRYLVAGPNTLAVEIHNTNGSTDLTGIPFLTLGTTVEADNSRGIPAFLKLNTPELHTNFKLSSGGDTVLFSSPAGTILDKMSFGAIPKDISFGAQPDGTDSLYFFAIPSPKKSNSYQGYSASENADPVFSLPAGYYNSYVITSISGAGPQDTIWYTLDGSDPKPGDLKYTNILTISKTTVVKACISGPNKLPGRFATSTYIVNDARPTLTTVSLSTNPENFFDWNTGIYELGPNAESANPNFGANFWQEWEKPVHIELFEKDGTRALDVNAGVKIAGAWSRANPQKSLAFYARGNYGTPSFKYKFFKDPDFKEYQNFLLRNSGNDFNNTQFRDGFLQGLLDGTAIDRMAYRPASVYINGQYWGLMDLREKINENYLAAHHGVDPLEVDLLEVNSSPISGDAESYTSMLNYLSNNSPATKPAYDSVKSWIDLDNYIDYQLSEIYFNNTDWPGNNIKYWRPRTVGGKWRWILYDTDFGFGIWSSADYANNTLSFALNPDGPSWPNPSWSTFLFRKMVESPEFKIRFINRFADMLNSNFTYQRVLGKLNAMQDEIKDEIPLHLDRWNGSYNSWLYNVDNMRTFASKRIGYMDRFIKNQFKLTGYDTLTLETAEANSGKIGLNTLMISSFPWSGIYFFNVPIPVSALPSPGYRFVSWEGPVADQYAMNTTVNFTAKGKLKAIFEKDDSELSNIVINEINYNSAPDFNPEDWVELYNKGIYAMNISGWQIKDDDNLHKFIIPENTYIYPDDYLVLSKESEKFATAFPSKSFPSGDFSFGLGSTSDCVRLYTPDSLIVDSVMYFSTAPWPTEPNGTGASLELINPSYDNALASSWKSSPLPHGTPGEKNGSYINVSVTEGPMANGNLLLEQNYPNPFTITTGIRFEVPKRDHVRLTIYDMQGRVVSMLINGQMDPGRHDTFWDGTSGDGIKLPSGMYILRLETSGLSANRRMTIIR
jgi:hypothetical protein